jgi:undecaprenyl-diphosphatase
MGVELDFLDKIQMKRTPFLDRAMPVVSNSVALYPLVDFILLANKKTRREGLIMAASLTMSATESNFILKKLFKRARPYMQRSHIKILDKMPTDFSFPSAHTSVAFSGAAAAYYAGSRKLSIPLYIHAALVAFSRQYLYVHYPTDIAGGAVFGQFCGWLGMKMVDAGQSGR